MSTGERVRQYMDGHPDATYRQAMVALGIKSTSVIHHHIRTKSKVALLRKAPDDCEKQLAQCLGPDTEAGRNARSVLEATK